MSKQWTRFQKWETTEWEKEGKENGYSRFTQSIQDAWVADKLTPKAVFVYMMLKKKALGKSSCVMPRNEYKKWCSSGGFNKAIKQLVELGYVYITRDGQKSNVYGFSMEWSIRHRKNKGYTL